MPRGHRGDAPRSACSQVLSLFQRPGASRNRAEAARAALEQRSPNEPPLSLEVARLGSAALTAVSGELGTARWGAPEFQCGGSSRCGRAGVARRFVAHQRTSEEDNVFKHNLTRFWPTAGLAILAAAVVLIAAGFAAAAQARFALQVPFCAPTETVCNTLEPGVAPKQAPAAKPARRQVPFCAPTETVCNTLEPGVSPKQAAGPVAHA